MTLTVPNTSTDKHHSQAVLSETVTKRFCVAIFSQRVDGLVKTLAVA